MIWHVTREGCLDDWQRKVWDSAYVQGFDAGHQKGVVQTVVKTIEYMESKGLDVPHGMRDFLLVLVDGENE